MFARLPGSDIAVKHGVLTAVSIAKGGTDGNCVRLFCSPLNIFVEMVMRIKQEIVVTN